MKSVTLELPDTLAESLDRAAKDALLPPGQMATAILSQVLDQRAHAERLAELATSADPVRLRAILDRVPDVPPEPGDERLSALADQPILPDAVRRVEIDAVTRGLPIRIVKTEASARTAEEAAAAVGVSVGQIVKSLVFRGKETGRAYLLLVSGSNRVDEKRAADLLGEPIERPNAAFVREATGFAIGGVSPLGMPPDIATLFDEDLLSHPVVWAAAGTPLHVFEVEPRRLMEAVGAQATTIFS